MAHADDITVWREQLKTLLGNDAGGYPTQLEALFPRILGEIVNLWGTPELDGYFRGLTLTDRSGRHGFSEAVATELFRLAQIHARLTKSDGGWWVDLPYFKDQQEAD
ncbi:MAG: hypothetical protein LBV49_00320 [Azonexus sp.]|jgi:hypothetical protein|nr:hypothetical protein [Azonexus sp.]